MAKEIIEFILKNKNEISSVISIIVAIIILGASFFQWWVGTYNGGMITKRWVKVLFFILISFLVFSLVLIIL